MNEIESQLKTVLQEFYRRVQEDLMIGFFFKKSNIERLIERESELILDAWTQENSRYQGRDLVEVHRPFKIRKGHFLRREIILKEVLANATLPEGLKSAWLAHAKDMSRRLTENLDC